MIPSHATVSSMFCWVMSAGKMAPWSPGKNLPKIVGPRRMPTRISPVMAGWPTRRSRSPAVLASPRSRLTCKRKTRMWLSSR